MSVLVNILLPVFIVAGLSALAQHRLKLNVQTFSKAAFYVFSPAMVIDAFFNSDVSGKEFGQIALALTLTVLLLWILGEVASRILDLESGTRAAFLAAVLLSNAGNYGLPVNYFAFGDPGLARAALYVTINSVLRSTLGVYITARGDATSATESLRRVFSVPVIYAAMIGIVFNVMDWPMPEPILRAASIMGQGLVPSSLVVLGTQIMRTIRDRQEATKPIALGVMGFGRLLLAPVVAYLVGGLIGLEGLSRKVLTLESATPTAVMTLVLATEYETDVPFAALSVLVTTLISLLSVAVWLRLLTS
jgi:hypothetical protein